MAVSAHSEEHKSEGLYIYGGRRESILWGVCELPDTRYKQSIFERFRAIPALARHAAAVKSGQAGIMRRERARLKEYSYNYDICKGLIFSRARAIRGDGI